MKTIQKGILIIFGFITIALSLALTVPALAQTNDYVVQFDNYTLDLTTATPLATNDIPEYATFYFLSNYEQIGDPAPFPFDMYFPWAPVYLLGTDNNGGGAYLVDDIVNPATNACEQIDWPVSTNSLSLVDPASITNTSVVFYLYQDQFDTNLPAPGPPPYPYIPDFAQGAPVYALTTNNQYLIDDSGLTRPDGNLSLAAQGSLISIGNSLALYITAISNGTAFLVLTNTQTGVDYDIQYKQTLADPNWGYVGTITGATNQTFTPFVVPVGSSSSLFFRAMVSVQVGDLWLEIPSGGVQAGQMTVVLHNTVEGQPYDVLTTSSLTNGWAVTQSVLGSASNSTTITLALSGQNSLFVKARDAGDSHDTGIPDWWQLLHFGYIGIDPYALDSSGDGWTLLQDYVNGFVPGQFNTPAAPQGLSVSYSVTNGAVNVSWLPSPGRVAGYTVEKYDYQTSVTQDFTLAGDATTLSDLILDSPSLIPGQPAEINATYKIQANYTNGNSYWSAPVLLEPNYDSLTFWYRGNLSAYFIPGPQGSAYLAANALPLGTVALRVTRIDSEAYYSYGDPSFNLAWDVPITSLTNGLYLLPPSIATGPTDPYGVASYAWYVQAVNASNTPSAPTGVNYYNEPTGSVGYLMPPYFDGRTQLLQNLTFLLRAATVSYPFHYDDLIDGIYDHSDAGVTNCATSSFYLLNNDAFYPDNIGFDALLPFENNYFFRNFAFNPSDVDPNSGLLTTGVGIGQNDDLVLSSPATYQFQPPVTTGGTIAAVLATNQTRWLFTSWFDYEKGVTSNQTSFAMSANTINVFGLPYRSAELAYGTGSGLGLYLLEAGGTSPPQGFVYPEMALPNFQFLEYDFWQPGVDWLPGRNEFSPTNTSHVLIASVGSAFSIAGYAKLAVQNSYSGAVGYLGQYFDYALEIDANGNVKTNLAGILSPYGTFFPTNPGPAALVTMPDLYSGQRGTGVVNVIKLQLDANHDGTMDLSFSGPDNTSQARPYVHWINNNFDRFTVDPDDQVLYDDDVSSNSPDAESPFTEKPTPDYDYKDGGGTRTIPCARDLEDFARLWICGVTSNLLGALPNGSIVTLNWGDVGNPNSNNPTIDLFMAADADGGTGYLTNGSIASEQTDSAFRPCIGRLGPGQSIQLNANQFANNWAGNYFIWCGVIGGSGSLNLTIADSNGNTLAQSTAFIQIKDIKLMYERWTIGDDPHRTPNANAALAQEELTPPAIAFQYSYNPVTDENTPYILYVHGWNMNRYDKDRFAECAFKRLYWQGYQGRFGVFRWPTGYGFAGDIFGSWNNPLTDPHNYDNSELTAWESATGLLNKLTDLNTKYPGRVYVVAHSMGNVVTGEALRLAGANQIVNTYVSSQGAIPAHVYDSTVTNLIDFSHTNPSIPGFLRRASWGPDTPNIYGNRLAGNSAAVGRRVNFFNSNDYALSPDAWCFNQEWKPDTFLEGFYSYTGSTNDSAPWNHFAFSPAIGSPYTLDIVTSQQDLYTVMAFAAEPRSRALGTTAGVGGMANVNLQSIWLPDPAGNNYRAHFWHSAQFRGDYWQQQSYWSELLGDDAFRLK